MDGNGDGDARALPNLSGVSLHGATTGMLGNNNNNNSSAFAKSPRGIVGISLKKFDRTPKKEFYWYPEFLYHMGADNPHVQAVLGIARALSEKYKDMVKDGPKYPKYPANSPFPYEWKPLKPGRAYDQKLSYASAKVVEPNGKEQFYYGELLASPGITDGVGNVATSVPYIRISTKVPANVNGFVPYTVFALQHDPNNLSAVPFRVF